MRLRGALALVALVAAGCTEHNTILTGGDRDIEGPQGLPAMKGAAYIDVPTIIVGSANLSQLPAIDRSQQINFTTESGYAPTPEQRQIEATRLVVAMNLFDEKYAPIGDTQLAKARRRQVQDAIIAASDSLCRDYKSELNNFNVRNNFLFGSLSSILGTLGSIFTPAATARSLAGASTIFGAERTEINADVFQQQAIQVVTNAFDQRRRRMLNVMACHATEGLSTYTLERAVAQAFRYHAACSLVAGLEEANKDTTQGSDIGLAAAHQTMQTIALIYEDTHGGKNGPFNAPATSSGLSPTVSNSTPTPTPVCQTLLATEDTPSEATSLAAMTPYEIANSAKLTAQSKTDAFHTTVSAALSTAQGISSDADLAKDLTTLSKQIDTSLGQFKSAADRWYAGQAQLTGQIEIASLRYDSATGANGATDALNAQKDFYTAQSTALSVSNNLSGASIVGVNLELANFNSAVSAAMSDGGALLSTSAALSATQDLQAYCPGTSYVRPTPGNPAQACPAKTSWLDGGPARGVALARAGDFVTTGAAGIPDRAMAAARLASAPIAASTSAAADRNDSSLPPVAAAATPFPPRRRLVAVLASSASPPDWLDRPPDRVTIQ